MRTRPDFVVVGGGFSGCTSARLLAEAGGRVLVVEREPHIGGHCYDYRNPYGITVHAHGPHIFHTNDGEVWRFVNRFSEFHTYQHRVQSWVEERLLPFPINIETMRAIFGPIAGAEEARSLLQAEVTKSYFRDPPVSFRDAVVSRVGETLYRLFFENYTRKQWGRDPEKILPEVARRIPIRHDGESRYFTDLWQGIPIQGYTALMGSMLNHTNIEVRLNQDWMAIRGELTPAMTIYTGELDALFGRRLGELPYRSLRFRWRTYRRERFQPVAVVNYPNEKAYTRITEYKHFLDEPSAWTTVSYEYPCESGPPYYILATRAILERRDRYISAAELLREQVLISGRLAEYRYYNMDQAVRAAMDNIRAYLRRAHEQ